MIKYFLPSAQTLIEKRGAENALAAALAFISGTTEIVNRSMLTSQAVSSLDLFYAIFILIYILTNFLYNTE